MKHSSRPQPPAPISPFSDLALALEAITALARRGADVALAQQPGQYTVTVTRAPQHLDVAAVVASLSRKLPPERQIELEALLDSQPQVGQFQASLGQGQYTAFMTALDAWYERLEAFSVTSGPGLVPGKLVAWQLGEETAFYVVVEVQLTRTRLQHIVYLEGYTWEGVGRDGWCPSATVRAQIERQEAVSRAQSGQAQ